MSFYFLTTNLATLNTNLAFQYFEATNNLTGGNVAYYENEKNVISLVQNYYNNTLVKGQDYTIASGFPKCKHNFQSYWQNVFTDSGVKCRIRIVNGVSKSVMLLTPISGDVPANDYIYARYDYLKE